MVIRGSSKRVLNQVVEPVDKVGYFGTLLLTHKDWDKPEPHLAEQVMPKLQQHSSRSDIS
jgi:hypothetical protein